MLVQWYPGHMAKAKRLLLENAKMVNAVVEICDARIPMSSRNPDIPTLLPNKPRVVILNKADLADPQVLSMWEAQFRREGVQTMRFVSNKRGGAQKVQEALQRAAADVIAQWSKRGVKRTLRAMVVGIPNVGKSTFINNIAGSASAKSGDRPGVTRGKQWIRIGPYLELLDTPGLLWPKFEDQRIGRNLAMTGAIREEVVNGFEIVCALLLYLREHYLEALTGRYKLQEIHEDPQVALEDICRARGWLISGGEPDLDRGAKTVLDEFQGGRMGRICLERPEDFLEQHETIGPAMERPEPVTTIDISDVEEPDDWSDTEEPL